MEEKMNSFKRFLLSEENIKAGPAEAAEMVFADCQPFLKEVDYRHYLGEDQNLYLYRGMPRSLSVFFTKNAVHQNRQPRDMPIEYHDALDSYLYKKFRIKYRSNAVFTTGEPGRATDYGVVHMIFPIGEFSFIWEENIKDVWENLVFPRMHLENKTKYRPRSGSEDPVEIFSEMMRVEDYYEDTDLKSAISSGNEIMINCKYYYAVHDGNSYCEKFKEHLMKLSKNS